MHQVQTWCSAYSHIHFSLECTLHLHKNECMRLACDGGGAHTEAHNSWCTVALYRIEMNQVWLHKTYLHVTVTQEECELLIIAAWISLLPSPPSCLQFFCTSALHFAADTRRWNPCSTVSRSCWRFEKQTVWTLWKKEKPTKFNTYQIVFRHITAVHMSASTNIY